MAEPQVQQITQTQTTIPDYAKPYVENMLGTAGSLVYNYRDPVTGEIEYDAAGLPIPKGFQPYMQYQGERFAQFSPLQQKAFSQAEQMQAAPQLEDATALAGLAGLRALGYGYTPGQFTNQFVRPEQFQPSRFEAPGVSTRALEKYQLGDAERVLSMAVQSPQIQAAQAQYAPDLRAYQMGPAQEVRTQTLAQFRPSDLPQLPADITSRTPQQKADYYNRLRGQGYSDAQIRAAAGTQTDTDWSALQRIAAERGGPPQTLAEAYMSPYMQSVVDIQQREAQRQADIAATARGQRYARAGAFGGARQAIENAEAARNLAMQKGDIQAAGLQSAYQQAQQQFNAEQAARLQASLANQQAGITVGGQNLASALGTQQLGVQTGLQTTLANLSNAQQAAVLNAANNLQAQGMTAQQALQAALANQQAGITLGTQNLAAQLGTQQLGATQDLQAQLANQQARLQAQQMAEQSKQYGYGQQLQSSALGAQYGQAAQQLGEQSAQFGAGLGLQGLQAAMQGAQQLGQLGQTQFGQNMALNQLLAQYGGLQQQQAQNILGAQYQDFLNFQNHPYKQMGFMSDMLRGLPLAQGASTMYQAAPSTVSQLAGLGTAAYGASKLFGMKEGGKVEDVAYREKPAGLADLAIYNMSV